MLRDARDRGRAGSDPRQAYFEWGDPEAWSGCASPQCDHAKTAVGCALDDEERWARIIPTLDRRVARENVRAFRQSLSPREFARELMVWWEDPVGVVDVFGPGNWGACAVEGALPPVLAVGVAVSVDQDFASIGAAGVWWEDGRPFVGSVDRRPGTAWVVEEVTRIQRAHGCEVVVDVKGPASDLIDDLEDGGVVVTPAKLDDYADACATVYRDVTERRMAHMHTTELDDAVRGAGWRPVGDRRVWGRKASSTDVSMLEAVTLARWAADKDYDVLDSVG